MDRASPSPALKPQSEEPPAPHAPASLADAVVKECVGYFAGWFDIGQLAAGRRLKRAGVRTSLLNDV
jgi:hypothetical protein